MILSESDISESKVNGDSFGSTVAERVYHILLKKILSKEFESGKRLPRRKLAEMTGVSQIPVLEAMKRLEQEGLVEYRARWGCVVVTPTLERIKDMFALREAIECQVVRILATEATASQLAELTSLAKELDDLHYSSESEDQLTEKHHQFHTRMADFSNRDSLVSTLRRINFFWLLWQGVKTGRAKEDVPAGWHERLVSAVRSGDPERAELEMREHIRTAYLPLIAEYSAADETSPR